LGHPSQLDREIVLRRLRLVEIKGKPIHESPLRAVVLSNQPSVTVNLLEEPIIAKNAEKDPPFDGVAVYQTPGGNNFVKTFQFKADESTTRPYLRNGIAIGHGNAQNDMLKEYQKILTGHKTFFGDLEKVLVVISNRPLSHFYLVKSNLEAGIVHNNKEDVIPEEVIIVCNENFREYSGYLAQFLWKEALIELEIQRGGIAPEMIEIPTTKLQSYETLRSSLANHFYPTADPKKVLVERLNNTKASKLDDKDVWCLDNNGGHRKKLKISLGDPMIV